MKRIFTALVYSLFPAWVMAQPANINLSNTIYFEGEPYVAVNPANPQNIVVAWMAGDISTAFRVAIKTKASFDGGATWGSQFIQPHFGTTWHSADVSMQFRKNGIVYLSYVDYHEAPDSGGVFITHSADGGVTWSAPTQVWNGLAEDPAKRPLDRPWLAADNSGTVNDGMLYLTTKPAPWIPAPNRPYLKSSADSGKTWSAYRYIDTTNYLVGNIIAAPMAAPAVAADGALCVAYPTYLASQSVYPQYFLAKSYNRGASFQYYSLLVNPTSVSDTLYKLGYRLAANPANANQLAFAWVGKPNGDPDIFVTTTNNGGVSWSTSARVNDDAVGNGKSQDMVWASYDKNGKLVIAWRDRRNGSGTGFYQSSDTYCAVSKDNGASFSTNIRLSDMTAPFDSVLMKDGNDFLSCQLLNDTIYAAWGDVRSGNLNIYFAKVSDSTGVGTGTILVDGDEDGQLSVYSNPAFGSLTISLKDVSNKNVEVKIFDAEGREVQHYFYKNFSSSSILDVSKLAAGNYFIRAVVGELEYVGKFAVER